MKMELSKTFVVRLPFQGAHPDSLSQNVRVPCAGTLPRASSGIFLTARPLPSTSGWQLQTSTVDFYHLDICHARHTKKTNLLKEKRLVKNSRVNLFSTLLLAKFQIYQFL